MTVLALIFALAIHLALMNLALAGPLVCIGLDWMEGRGDGLAGKVGRRLIWVSLAAIAVGSVLGVVVAVLDWNEVMHDAGHRLKSRFVYGGIELIFSVVLMLIYAFWWSKTAASGSSDEPKKDGGKWHRVGRTIVMLLSGTNLIYHFPLLFVMFSNLQVVGEHKGEEILGSKAFLALVDSNVLARSVHFVLASFAVCGAYLMWRAYKQIKAGDVADGERVASWGARLALTPTLLQLPVGFWVTLKLPKIQMKQLMGQDMACTVLFLVSIVLAFGLMHHLAMVKGKDKRPSAILRTVIMLYAVILAMTGTLVLSKRIDPIPPVIEEPIDNADRTTD
ncbi:MAG: hypothetical protein ACI9HK_001770 [Pirellulaceae bacterium]|jgi:hypothetical protein